MAWQFSVNVLIMMIAGAISVTVAFFTIRRREAPGSKPLVAVNVIGGFWAWMAALELASASLGTAAVFHRVSFLSMSTIGVVWFLFAAEYAGHYRWLRPRYIAGLCLLPFTTQVLVWTDPLHGLMFESLRMEVAGDVLVLVKHPGIWWWVDSVYAYGLLFAGLAILGHLFFRAFGLYRRQVVALVAGLVVPMSADFIFVQGIGGGSKYNYAPALFAWVGLMLYWGFTRFQLLDVTPVAREFVAEHLADALIVTDTEDRTTYTNLSAEELLGVHSREIVGKPLVEVVADKPGLYSIYRQARDLSGDGPKEWEYEGRYYDSRLSALRDGRGRVRGTILILRDTTDRKVAEVALDAARQELEDRVEERTAELVAEKEHLAQLNTMAVQIARCVSSADILRVGAGRACTAVGSDAGTLWLRSRKGGMEFLTNEGLSEDTWETLRRGLEGSEAVTQAMAEGTPICVDVDSLATGFEDPGSMCSISDLARVAVIPLVSRGLNLGSLVLVSRDVAFARDPQTILLAGAIASQVAVALENVRRYEDAQFLAERDSLTRLFNHRGFNRRLEQEVARCEESGQVFGLVMIDVDNFKLFNDAYGHVVGDRVLQGVARILTSALRRSDVVARYGGDEFIAILPDADADAAVQLVERIRAFLDGSPFLVGDGRTVPLKMSYGVATFPLDGASPAELLAAADANLYRSKRHGGDFITASGADEASHPASMGSFSVLDGLVTTVDHKDHYTRRHSDDVTEFALALASKMGLSLETQRSVRVAGLLHDVGKLGVPDHILRKPAGLTEAEFETIKNHVTLGELIIQGIPNQEEVISAVGTHHERFDGRGYPRGLRGEEIPLLGRILAVTDAYSAMTTDRPYRKALDPIKARVELQRVAGTQLDPKIVEVFLEVLDDDEVNQGARVAMFASGRP